MRPVATSTRSIRDCARRVRRSIARYRGGFRRKRFVMDELSARARSLLDAASLGDDPTADDAHRVRHAVLLRVGAIGVGTAALATSTAQAKGILSTLAA